MKKLFVSLALCALMMVAVATPAFTHNGAGHGGAVHSGKSYAQCSVINCDQTGYHKHNGITYAGHTINDGRGYHQFCPVANCTMDGSRNYNGVRGYRGGHH